MKKAREKAIEWLEKNGYMATPETIKELDLLLRQQDRDTRHACAEAVLTIKDPEGAFFEESLITRNTAHATIMNTRAI